MPSMDEITIIELVLEKELLKDLTVIAEVSDIPVEAVIIMACRKYVKFVNQHGFPKVTGVRFTMTDEEIRRILGEDE
jgi:hypothetical protein